MYSPLPFKSFYVKFGDFKPVAIKTHSFVQSTGQWAQTIFKIGDLIEDFQKRPGSVLANIDSGSFTIHFALTEPSAVSLVENSFFVARSRVTFSPFKSRNAH